MAYLLMTIGSGSAPGRIPSLEAFCHVATDVAAVEKLRWKEFLE